MILYKDGIIRDIKESRVQEYIAAGWQIEQKLVQQPVKVVEAEEVVLKPPARVKGAVKPADDNAITQGE